MRREEREEETHVHCALFVCCMLRAVCCVLCPVRCVLCDVSCVLMLTQTSLPPSPSFSLSPSPSFSLPPFPSSSSVGLLREWLGEGIFTIRHGDPTKEEEQGEHDKWVFQRKVAAGIFTRGAFKV